MYQCEKPALYLERVDDVWSMSLEGEEGPFLRSDVLDTFSAQLVASRWRTYDALHEDTAACRDYLSKLNEVNPHVTELGHADREFYFNRAASVEQPVALFQVITHAHDGVGEFQFVFFKRQPPKAVKIFLDGAYHIERLTLDSSVWLEFTEVFN